jgi:hypothetical protein
MVPKDPALFEYAALPGWKALARELQRHHWKNKLHIHSTNHWIIVHREYGILIKNIIKHDVDNGIITIHSINPDYPDKELCLDDVDQLFNVVRYEVEK